eukprot:gene10029-13485_t
MALKLMEYGNGGSIKNLLDNKLACTMPIELSNTISNNTNQIKSYDFDLVNNDVLEKRAIIVRELLSKQECEKLIEFINTKEHLPNFEGEIVMTDASNKLEYRNNQRMIVISDNIASVLFERIRSVLTVIGEHEIICNRNINGDNFINNGIGMNGQWRFHSLNPCLRLCKYHPGGHFGPHYDSDFVIDPLLLRSIKTFMIYLNDDYEGGTTNFSESHNLYIDPDRNIYCSPEDKIYSKVKAYCGDCLIFDHKILHEGEQVRSGCKYIMRTEIIYEKNTLFKMENDEEDIKCASALKIYYEGMALEENHQVDSAIKKYKQAFKMYPDLEKYM